MRSATAAGEVANGQYDAFLSYSHVRDSELGPQLKELIEKYGRPWNRPRARRLFVDNSNLAVATDLWGNIEKALASSDCFLLLASPEAAASTWVEKEVRWWLQQHESASELKLYVLLTGGTFDWDDCLDRVDPKTTALPSVLHEAMRVEPRLVDLRPLRGTTPDLNDPDWHDRIADIVAAVDGVPKDSISGEPVRQARRTRRVVTGVITTLSLLLITALIAGVVAIVQRNNAEAGRRAVAARQLMAQAQSLIADDPRTALRLGAAAAHLNSTPETQSFLAELMRNTRYEGTVHGFDGRITSFRFTSDGHTLAAGTEEGSVSLWDLADPLRPRSLSKPVQPSQPWLGAVITSGDRFSVSADHGQAATLWDVDNLTRPQRIGAPFKFPVAGSVTVTSDGRTMAVAGQFGDLELWDITDPGQPHQTMFTPSNVVGGAPEFSPDGRTLLTEFKENPGLSLVDVADVHHPQLLGRPFAATAEQSSVRTFMPDGSLVCVVNGQMVRWDLSDRTHPQKTSVPLDGLPGEPATVSFAHDNDILVITIVGGTPSLWDIADLAHPRQLDKPIVNRQQFVGNAAPILAPDGRTLVTANDSSMSLWNLGNTAPQHLGQPLTTDGKSVDSLSFRSDGHVLATGNDDSTTMLWNVSDLNAPQHIGSPLVGVDGAQSLVSFAPDGQTLTAGVPFATPFQPALWDISDLNKIRKVGDTASVEVDETNSAAFSPDGRTIATANDSNVPVLWDFNDHAHPRRLNEPGTASGTWMSSVAYAPSGRLLATGSADFTATLWDVSNPSQPHAIGTKLVGHTNVVRAVTFTPDGNTLATGGDDGTIILWDVSDPGKPRRRGNPLVLDDPNQVLSVAFTSDGRIMTAASRTDVALWDVDDPSQPRRLTDPITAKTGQVSSMTIAADGRTLALGSSDGTVDLWDISSVLAAKDDSLTRACLVSGGGLDRDEWARYLADLDYEDSCSTT